MNVPRWRIYLKLGRVSNLPTVWSNTLAGLVLASARDGGADDAASIGAGRAALLAFAMSLFYVGGMFLNDAFDRKIDARERPERPIPAGLITPLEVYGVGYGLLAAGVALVIVDAAALGGSGIAVLSALGLSLTIVVYNAWHKGNPASPLLMGACRVLVYLTCALAASGTIGRDVLIGAALLLAHLMGLTYVAKQENLVQYKNMWPLVLLFVPPLVAIPFAWPNVVALLLVVVLVVWDLRAVSMLRGRGRGVIPKVVVSLIAGISLLDALVVASHGALAFAGAALCAFAATLFFQRWVAGT